MSRQSAVSQPSTSDPSPAAVELPDPFEGVTFETPVLQHAKRLLEPFLTREPSAAEGLREAIQELVRIDGIGRRYGSFEP